MIPPHDDDETPDDDGERIECAGCGESWNAGDSNARDADTYCSRDCERNDTSDDDGEPADDDGVDCATCYDGAVVCDTCDECGCRHCPECDGCG